MKKANILSKKIICILLILITILPNVLPTISRATEINEAYLQNKGDCGRHLQFWNETKNVWSYIITTYVVYNQNGTEYPSYCLERNVPGVRRRKCL